MREQNYLVAGRKPEEYNATRVFRFADLILQKPTSLTLILRVDADLNGIPDFVPRSTTSCRIGSAERIADDHIAYPIVVSAPVDLTQDDETLIDLVDPSHPDFPTCRVILRRTRCRIETALVARDHPARLLRPQTRAALLWRAWNRYEELVALKRFRGGYSGSDVLVFRPRLRTPGLPLSADHDLSDAEILKNAWGSCLLVKSGPAAPIRREWERSRAYLEDRLHPFLARCEDFLDVQPVGDGPEIELAREEATVLSSFLGGDLVRVEPLEQLLNGTDDVPLARKMIERVYANLVPWHATSRTRELGEWRRVFRPTGPEIADQPPEWLLFGKYDFTRAETDKQRHGRDEFTRGLRWDTSLIKGDHLKGHLLGKKGQRDGLLYELSKIPVKFSLVHGDLNPRNALGEGDDFWLIDFEHTGVGPTLYDYALLEANLRLWCLKLRPGGEDVEEAATAFETHLLDHFLGVEGGLEGIRSTADGLGADASELLKIAECIAHVRRLALAHCIDDRPDRRDYLAVLYLTVLSLLPFAGKPRPAPPMNFRLLVGLAWVLEQTLDRIFDREPFDRQSVPMDHRRLLSARWLEPPGAPGRVLYAFDRPDGLRALPALAATRGVLQNPIHHLDVFEHSVLTLGYVEALLDDAVAGLRDPVALDEKVAKSLAAQGFALPPMPERSPHETRSQRILAARLLEALAPHEAAIRETIAAATAGDGALAIKWAALLHDVGKPGTRAVKKTASGLKVVFQGHEIYGLQLLDETLRRLFGKDCDRCRLPMRESPNWTCMACGNVIPRTRPDTLSRVRRLIRRHLHHHDYVRYLTKNPHRLDILANAILNGRIPIEEQSFAERLFGTEGFGLNFPLLILHGFADRLASRGPLDDTCFELMGAIDLLLLSLNAHYPRLRAARDDSRRTRADWNQKYEELLRQLPQERGRALGLSRVRLSRVRERVLMEYELRGGQFPSLPQLENWIAEIREESELSDADVGSGLVPPTDLS